MDCKYRELIFKTQITDFLIFSPEKPFGQLFSKIRLKLAREFLVLRNPTKSRIAVSRCGSQIFNRKLGHIHITLGEKRLGQLKRSFTCMFGITITTQRRKNVAKKYIFTSG